MPIFYKKIYKPNAPKVRIDITKITMMSILILILLQAIGVLFDLQGIKLGPIFLLLLIAAIVLTAFAIAKRSMQGVAVGRKDVFILVSITLITVLALFYLRELVPEIFKPGIVELKVIVQSFLPIP